MAGHAWPWAAQRTNTARQPVKGQKNREKFPQTTETTYQKDQDREGKLGPEKKLRHRALRRAAPVRARRGQRRPKTATTSRNWQGASARGQL